MRGAVLLLFLCGSLAAQPAALEGVVVNSITGEPLGGVHVRLFSGSPGTYAAVVYGALTGSGGKFSVDPIAPGAYHALLERPGFLSRIAVKPVVKLKPGERVSDLKLDMAPRATISGRVLDEYGDPVQHVSVRASPLGGRPAFDVRSAFAITDDRGEFRVGVGPGKYYVKASPQTVPSNEGAEVRTDGTTEAVYGDTYYPSATTEELAVAVETAGGREAAGCDIRLARRPNLSISGVVPGLPGGHSSASVNLLLCTGTGRILMANAAPVREDGRFVFRHLAPGLYRMVAKSSSVEGRRLYSPLLELTLEGADIAGIRLPLAPAEDVTGSVQFEGEPAEAASVEGLTISLEPLIMGGMVARGMESAKAGKNGAFRLAAVAPERYRIRVRPMPENGYIKTVHSDGTAVSDDVLDLGQGGGPVVRIVLSRNGAQISGSVKGPDGAAVSEPDGLVYLFQDPESLRVENRCKISPDGTYVFKGVRPGTYRLIAVDPLFLAGGPGSEGTKELAARAAQIDVKEGDRLTKDLTITVREADANKR